MVADLLYSSTCGACRHCGADEPARGSTVGHTASSLVTLPLKKLILRAMYCPCVSVQYDGKYYALKALSKGHVVQTGLQVRGGGRQPLRSAFAPQASQQPGVAALGCATVCGALWQQHKKQVAP